FVLMIPSSATTPEESWKIRTARRLAAERSTGPLRTKSAPTPELFTVPRATGRSGRPGDGDSERLAQAATFGRIIHGPRPRTSTPRIDTNGRQLHTDHHQARRLRQREGGQDRRASRGAGIQDPGEPSDAHDRRAGRRVLRRASRAALFQIV